MKNEKNYVGFLFPKTLQILKHFSWFLSCPRTLYFWRVISQNQVRSNTKVCCSITNYNVIRYDHTKFLNRSWDQTKPSRLSECIFLPMNRVDGGVYSKSLPNAYMCNNCTEKIANKISRSPMMTKKLKKCNNEFIFMCGQN